MTTHDGALAGTLLLDPAIIDEPAAFYHRLLAEAPVWRIPGSPIVVVSSFAAVSEVVTRTDDFSSNLRALLYRGPHDAPELLPFDVGMQALATADPPTHTTHRRAVFPELVARRMATLRPDVEALAREHLARALAKPGFEVMGDLANAIPIRVVSRLIGFSSADPDRLLAAAFDSTDMIAATRTLEEVHAAMARTADVMGWISDQLQHAADHGADGILGAMGSAVADGSLAFGDGLVILHTLLSAGGESTTSLLGNAIHLLALDQDLQARLRAQPALVEPFIEEALRLESPFRHHLRHVPRATELRGVPIDAEATMLLLWGAANRDPAEYDCPDEIVLDRPTPKHHVAFGRGIHFCVGAPLARLEARVVLGELLARTEHFALDPGRAPVRENSLMVRRFRSLHLTATSR
ncbi:cytochrome P450 [Candidatus Binatia bacterium]|nr:cytochrome P450 [Candidatus Binatia bacterium]